VLPGLFQILNSSQKAGKIFLIKKKFKFSPRAELNDT